MDRKEIKKTLLMSSFFGAVIVSVVFLGVNSINRERGRAAQQQRERERPLREQKAKEEVDRKRLAAVKKLAEERATAEQERLAREETKAEALEKQKRIRETQRINREYRAGVKKAIFEGKWFRDTVDLHIGMSDWDVMALWGLPNDTNRNATTESDGTILRTEQWIYERDKPHKGNKFHLLGFENGLLKSYAEM